VAAVKETSLSGNRTNRTLPPDASLRAMNARALILRMHLVVGCIAAPFLLIAGFSGALLVFGDAYTDRVTNARLTHVEEGSGPTVYVDP
jgi:uncharacterized iron-regulated membrane protein